MMEKRSFWNILQNETSFSTSGNVFQWLECCSVKAKVASSNLVVPVEAGSWVKTQPPFGTRDRGEVLLHTEAWSRDPSAKTSLSQNEKGFFTGVKGYPLKALF
jgi:hypothetical protein